MLHHVASVLRCSGCCGDCLCRATLWSVAIPDVCMKARLHGKIWQLNSYRLFCTFFGAFTRQPLSCLISQVFEPHSRQICASLAVGWSGRSPAMGSAGRQMQHCFKSECFQSFQVGLDALQEPPTEPCLILDFKVPFPLQSWLGCIQMVALENRGRCSTSTHVFCTLRLDDLQNSRSLHTIFDHHSCIHFALRVSQSLWLIVEVPMSGASCTHDVLTEWSVFFIPSGQGGLWLTSVYWICGCLTSLPTIVFMYVSIPHPFFQSACS